jgi:hypothetical protein
MPVTSYGYQPPPGAVPMRWACLDRDCGVVGDEPPRRWPFPCERCGGQTDPVLAEPWAHEARGVELRYLLAHDVQDGGFTEFQLLLWQFKEALRTGDTNAASRARADFRVLDKKRRSESDMWIPGYGYFSLVWDALEAGDLDSAADDLVHWFDVSSSEDVENHNSRRTNCRQAIDSALRFFGKPGGERHPQAAVIRQKCLDLAGGSYEVLSHDLQTGVRRLSRT